MRTYPEVDRGAWYGPNAARMIINPAQIPFIDELAEILATRPPAK
jgi:predicted NUDIX family NTP pyrophosphohydrolase